MEVVYIIFKIYNKHPALFSNYLLSQYYLSIKDTAVNMAKYLLSG